MEYLIKLKAGNEQNDLEIWKWLAAMVEHLGPDGMSSEESSTEGIESVYRVKPLWLGDGMSHNTWTSLITKGIETQTSSLHKELNRPNEYVGQPICRVPVLQCANYRKYFTTKIGLKDSTSIAGRH